MILHAYMKTQGVKMKGKEDPKGQNERKWTVRRQKWKEMKAQKAKMKGEKAKMKGNEDPKGQNKRK